MKTSQLEIKRKKKNKKYKKKRYVHSGLAHKEKVPKIVAVKETPQPQPETKHEVKKEKRSSVLHAIRSIHKKRHTKPTLKHLKRYDSDLQLILFPLILVVILFTMVVFSEQLNKTVPAQALDPIENNTQMHPYPFVQAVQEPSVSAKAAIIVDRDSQVMLFSKNPQLRFSMASTTKIMTALTGLDYYGLSDVLTIKRSYVAGSGLSLYPGQQFHFIDLLYAMLLPSANDAAQAVADNYPGGAQAFVNRMNEKAKSLHLINTHYADPTGLEDDGDYTTVIDMARLASYASTNPTFAEVTATKYRTISTVSFGQQYPLNNLNQLLGVDGVNGIKTGTTEGAGEVLVTSTVKNGHTYIIVVMNSNDRFYDTTTLLHFIDNNVQYIMPGSDK